MNVYIDLGVGTGDTILQFRNWKHLLESKGDEDWIAYGFEANPAMEKEWKRHVREDTIIQTKAAWTENGHIDISVNEVYYKSSVMKEKQDYGEGKLVKVPCFDFSHWLRRFKDDFVLLKFDIEGAELPILTKMIADGTDNIPALTMVEWHDGKMPQYKSNKHDILNQYRGRLVEWR